jgi:hypothetical protein
MAGETDVLEEKPHHPPQIPYDMTWCETQAALVGSRRLTAWNIVRLYFGLMREVNVKYFYKYYNGSDQRVARQQLCKHGPTRNNKGGRVFRIRDDVTQRWVVVTWHVFPVMRVCSSAI